MVSPCSARDTRFFLILSVEEIGGSCQEKCPGQGPGISWSSFDVGGLSYPFALVCTLGSSATLTQMCTCGWPRKYQTNEGPSSRQLSHSPSSPISPSL